MIEHLETLVALARTGTMMETATELSISQSAVSKRIASLERHYERKLIEREGRRVVLTHHGTHLVDQVRPIITELRSVFLEDSAVRQGKIIIGVSDAILASWGPGLFAAAHAALPGVELSFHAHRSPTVLDRIRAGEYMVGICTGASDTESDLQSEVMHHEPMVVIPSGLQPIEYSVGDRLEVITIESRSGAWASIEDELRRLQLVRAISLESFFAVAQMALAGFGHGLVPAGVAETLRVDTERLLVPDAQRLVRPVRFVARKSMFSRPTVQAFYRELELGLKQRQADLKGWLN